MNERETSAEIDAAAANWAVRVDDDSLDAAGQAELDAWLSGDIRRRGSFARAQAMLLHARRAKALGAGFDPDAYVAQHGDRPADAPGAIEAPTRRRFLLWAGSASAVAASGVGVVWLGLGLPSEAYATQRGEVRLVPLADGSRMTLNTASRAEIRFSRSERRVVLTDGEALFDVAKDAARPFYVVAGDVQVPRPIRAQRVDQACVIVQ